MKKHILSFLFIIAINIPVFAYQVDLETSALYKNVDINQNSAELERVGLSLKEIISDETGDRIYLFLRAEGENNFAHNLIDQLYAQYKGPMGRWNITIGRFTLPFGLLPNYDSEWLLVKTQEFKTIGIKFDSGVKLSGVIDDFGYAVSVSQGIGVDRWADADNDKLAVFRLDYQGEDFEDLRIGISASFGKVLTDVNSAYKKLIALDFSRNFDSFIGRGEVVYGKENDNNIFSAFLGIDYKIVSSVDLNFGFNHFQNNSNLSTITAGFTYNSPFFGLTIRIADKYRIEGGNNEFYLQIYKLFYSII